MAINWQKLELDIKNYLEKGRYDRNSNSYSIKNVAKRIEFLYLTEIKTNATDIFLNGVILITENEGSGLHKSLEAGFNSSFRTNNIDFLNQNGTAGVLQHWAGAQFSPVIPALPAMTVGINNSVTSVGSIFPMYLRQYSKGYYGQNDLLSKEVVKSLKAHAGTIGGLFTGLTSAGSPIAIPWLGII